MENNQNNIKKIIFIKDLGMLYPTKTSKCKTRYGIYLCPICESDFRTVSHDVKRGHTTKCKKCSHIKHGATVNGKRKRLYRIWAGVIGRCTNKRYENYNGRGIAVCGEWSNSYSMFEKWALANGYTEYLSIDRIDNDGNYEPSNCRWATIEIQSRNTRKLRATNKSEFRGVSRADNKWQVRIGVNKKGIYLGRYDCPIEAARVYDSYVIKHNLEHTRNFQVS